MAMFEPRRLLSLRASCLPVSSATRSYDSNELDRRLLEERNIQMIAPHLSTRKRKTQDGRPLRRYRRRWRVERGFAWLQNFRRLVTRWERKATNFLAFVRLGCIVILLRQM